MAKVSKPGDDSGSDENVMDSQEGESVEESMEVDKVANPFE